MIEILQSGQTFILFKSLSISRSMDDFSGQANMSISEEVQGQAYIKVGRLTNIKLDGFDVFTGCFESFENSESVGSHEISYSGRDKIATLIDSTIPDSCKNVLNVSSLKALCELIITGRKLNIKVIDETGANFGRVTTKAGDIGMKCVEYLEKYGKPLQAIFNTDGKGNLIIKKANKKLKTLLLNLENGKENNIIDSSLSYDISKRVHKIIYKSNGNCAFSEEGESFIINNKGEAEDEELKQLINIKDFGEKVEEIISDTPMNSLECKKAAQDEINIRRLRGFQYRVTVSGFSANNELWNCGYLVDVKDDIKKVYGTFLIKDVEWNTSGGELTTMNLTFPDGYTGKENLTGANKKQVVLPEYVG